MPYPESCFTDLIGVRGICSPQTAIYWLDDMPGVDLSKLADVANADAPSGQSMAAKLIESASRIMAADVEALYDAQYKVENTLVSGCSTCTFNNNYAGGIESGIMIKDNTTSSFSHLLIDKLIAKVNQTGNFTIVIDDGVAANQRLIPFDFEAGVEYEFVGLNFQTRAKQVRVFLQEPGIPLAQLSCKRGGSGCGCSGTQAVLQDLVYTGTLNGAEVQQGYGFLPCALIRCDAQDLLCFVAHSAPRMIGMALLYKTTELFFRNALASNRNNKTAGTNVDYMKDEATRFEKLYKDKLDGTKTRGVKDLVFTTLQQVQDVCIVCNSLIGTSWAAG